MNHIVKVEMYLELKDGETAEVMTQMENHVGLLIDTNSHPDIKTVFGIKVTKCTVDLSDKDDALRSLLVYIIKNWNPIVYPYGGNGVAKVSYMKPVSIEYPYYVNEELMQLIISYIEKYVDSKTPGMDVICALDTAFYQTLSEINFDISQYVYYTTDEATIGLTNKIQAYDCCHDYPSIVVFLNLFFQNHYSNARPTKEQIYDLCVITRDRIKRGQQ